jgi:hypothetical protein
MTIRITWFAAILAMIGALPSTTQATSPYDMPYGLQWNFMIGHPNADNPASCVASPDGTTWIATAGSGITGSGPTLTWGNPTSIYGGHFASGYGQISPLGHIMQANDIPAIPDLTGAGQSYMAGITMRGSTAHLTWYAGNALWANQTPPDLVPGGANPTTVSIAPVSIPQGTPYPNVAGLGDKYTHELLSTDGRTHDSVVAPDGAKYFVGANQTDDKFTVGDFNTNAIEYRPWVGMVDASGTNFSGPATQPSGDARRDYFTDVDINTSNGHVFAVGSSFQGSPTHWDPDGTGPLPAYAYNNSAGIGTAVLYDEAWNIVTSLVWNSNQDGDGILDCAASGDGWVAVGYTTGNLKTGATNPAPGTSDIYVARYTSAGALVWDYQSETSYDDFAGDVTVDPDDGAVYVSGRQTRTGATDRDPILLKFTAEGSLVWSTYTDNASSVDNCVDHAQITKHKVYLLSESNPSSGGPWTTTTGYTPQGTDEVLLQKVSPGDFDDGSASGTLDGLVNFDDVQYAGTQTFAGLPGVDTYDFDEDGDSTLADTHYMISNIMDRLVGDVHPGAISERLSDVDNADIGRAIGGYTGTNGIGKRYLEGDIDFDGDVDDTDIAYVANAFTGVLTPPIVRTTGITGAALIYDPADGQVLINTWKAAGHVITSFQLETLSGTFMPSNYTGVVTASFAGGLEELTTQVIADTDLTFTGFNGLRKLGKIFPAGMTNQVDLADYLITAVHTGEPGSGQRDFELVIIPDPAEPGVWLLVR